MKNLTNLIWQLRIWKDTRGQDLIEYALMAGFVAVAAGAIMPGVATSISTIFSKIGSVMTGAAATGAGSKFLPLPRGPKEDIGIRRDSPWPDGLAGGPSEPKQPSAARAWRNPPSAPLFFFFARGRMVASEFMELRGWPTS